MSDTASDPKTPQVSPESFVCPLSKVRPGTICRVKQLLGSREMCCRLRELGFCEEQKVRLLTQERTLICQVCDARFGLNAKLAEAIMVEPLGAGSKVA